MKIARHRFLGVALFGLTLLLGVPATAAHRLAVFRIDPLGIDPEIVARLEGLFRLELSRLADAKMPGPGEIEHALRRDHSLQNCTGGVGCLVRVGKLLDVEQVISGNVGGLADNFVVNLKIVDVKSEKEIRRIQEPISGRPDELIEAVRVAAYGLVAPERLRGALAVLADQPGGEVFLNGALVGKTPLPTIHGLAVGNHALRVSKAGYADVIETVRVRFQKTAQVVVQMQAPIKPAVVTAPRPVVRTTPWYTRWWFWTAVGVAAVGAGVALGYGLGASPKGINCDAEPARCH
jgi:hypothetical protein